jgi:hypothetical protein
MTTIQPGAVLELGAGEWAYGDGPLRLQVDRVRDDLSRYYDDKVWVEGYALDDSGTPVDWTQALVPVDVLTRHTNGARS